LKGASEKVKERAERLKNDVRGIISGLKDSLPRPLMERPTLILKEPVLARLHRRIRERRELG